jgi:outer membrane protein assembly factor BamB
MGIDPIHHEDFEVPQVLSSALALDTATGVELDREPLPGTTVFSVGTTIGPDGAVYVPSFLGELFAFGPE